MTSDCIYRDALLKDIEENVVFSGQTPNAEIVGANKVISRIKAASVADVAPVVHARWEMRRSSWYCTNCRRGYRSIYGSVPACQHSYCPNCGARMDGEDDKPSIPPPPTTDSVVTYGGRE